VVFGVRVEGAKRGRHLAALLLAALVVFCLANTDEVRVDYVVGKADLPLIEVMAGSGAAGLLIAALIRRRQR
jgi:uncharacterized integral membrane protein